MNAAARSNPRRRQRKLSDDSVATRQPVKRRKRAALTSQTFQATDANSPDGTTTQDPSNAVVKGSSAEVENEGAGDVADGTTLAFRDKSIRRRDELASPKRQTTSRIMTRNKNYLIDLLEATPDLLTAPNEPSNWHATLYPQYGYAVVTTDFEAIIWPYKNQSSSFGGRQQHVRVQLPLSPTKKNHALPFARLMRLSAELSLLVVTPHDGSIFFWESITEAASVDQNRQRQQSIRGSVGGMFSNELVTDVTDAESRGFVLTLSSGRLVHLSLIEDQGKTSIKTEIMRNSASQSSGIFGSLRGVFSGSGWKPIAAVRAADSARRGQRHVITATSTANFQIWEMNWNGTHTLERETNIRDDVFAAFKEDGSFGPVTASSGFEILDITLVASKHEQASKRGAVDEQVFHIMALSAIRGPQETSFAIFGIKLSKGDSVVETVRAVNYFADTHWSSSRFRPSVLVPEPSHAAILSFENAIVVMSLEQEEESPSSQLKIEAHQLPQAFQDVIRFKKDRSFRVVGSCAEPQLPNQKSSVCIIAVQHVGLIRLKVEPMKRNQSPITTADVTARDKLEQAVFFSDAPGNFIDFSIDEGDEYSEEEIEEAVVEVSRTITDMSSSYLNRLDSSIQNSLATRAARLKNLNWHVQNNFRFISKAARWRLLWNAEKVAAAQGLWQWYNESSTPPDHRKTIFAEMIEAIPETLKVENQPDQGETDGVRHWFTHDVWRLEWILPYSHEIVEILFRESNEDNRELDEATRAQMISIAAEMQLITLETAFAFRYANAEEYGFDQTLLDHGVLKTPDSYRSLPEFWTSSRLGGRQALVPTRVKEITDAAREMAKNLSVFVVELLEQQEEPKSPEERLSLDPDAVFIIAQQLSKKLPRQVDICEKVYKEYGNWLQAQADDKLRDQGKAIEYGYPRLRRQQLADLPEIGLVEEAITLAEKHGDMEALLDILESDNMDSNSLGPSIPRRVDSYFRNFGERWADAYFSRVLSRGQQAGDVLKNTEYKPYLTRFLRRHPEYASLAWINEISAERNYSRAAHALFEASQQTRDVWPEKIMLCLGKLSLLAAQSKDPAAPAPSASEAKRTDCSIEALQLQEDLFDTLKPYVKSAIDDDAAVDVVMDHHGINIIDNTPFLASQARSCLAGVLSHHTVPSSDIADLLSLLHEDSVQSEATIYIEQRYFIALRCLQLESVVRGLAMSSPELAPVFKAVWRRLLISSDWTSLSRTEKKSDAEVTNAIRETTLYRTLVKGYRFCSKEDGVNLWELLPPPASMDDLLNNGEQPNASQQRNGTQGDEDAKKLSEWARDIAFEDAKLRGYLDKGRLREWYPSVMEAARTAVQEEKSSRGRFKEQIAGELDLKAERPKARDVTVRKDVNGGN